MTRMASFGPIFVINFPAQGLLWSRLPSFGAHFRWVTFHLPLCHVLGSNLQPNKHQLVSERNEDIIEEEKNLPKAQTTHLTPLSRHSIIVY